VSEIVCYRSCPQVLNGKTVRQFRLLPVGTVYNIHPFSHTYLWRYTEHISDVLGCILLSVTLT